MKLNRWDGLIVPFTKAQLIVLFSIIGCPKIALICFIALRTGMRLNEVLTLMVTDIKWELKQIHKATTKGGKPRTYEIDDQVINILKKWVSLLGNKRYLFPSHKRNFPHMTGTGFYRQYRMYLKKAGLWEVAKVGGDGKSYHTYTFHTLRKSFISILINADVGIYTTSKLAGHSKISTTEKYYAHLGTPAKRKALSSAFGKTRGRAKEFDYATRSSSEGIGLGGALGVSALERLKLRLVNGEISEDEYRKLLVLISDSDVKTKREDYFG